MDNLKVQILLNLESYLCKLTRGYSLAYKDYKDILNAMMTVNALETFTFSDPIRDALISCHTLKLRN